MSVGPFQFDRFVEIIRSDFASITNLIQKHIRAVHDEEETNRNEQKEAQNRIESKLSAIAVSPDEKREAKTYRKANLAIQAALACFTLGAFLAASVYGALAYLQWQTMNETYIEIQQQTQAARENVVTEEEALAQNQFQDIQTLRQMQAQSGAARSGASTAKEALEVSERAYVSTGVPYPNWQTKALNIPIENKGHIPSGPIKILVFESTTITTPHAPDPPSYFTYACWHRIKLDTLYMGPSLISISVGARYFDPDKVRAGLESFQSVVDISYNDGFPRTPARHWQACQVGIANNGSVVSNPCFMANEAEQIIELSGYPNVLRACPDYPNQ